MGRSAPRLHGRWWSLLSPKLQLIQRKHLRQVFVQKQ